MMPVGTDPHVNLHLAFPLVSILQLFVLHSSLRLYSVKKLLDDGPLGVVTCGEIDVTWFGAAQTIGNGAEEVGVFVVQPESIG